VLGLAAGLGLVDLADAFARLKRTNFRHRQGITDPLQAVDRRPPRPPPPRRCRSPRPVAPIRLRPPGLAVPVILIPLGTAAARGPIVLRRIDSVDGMTARSVPMEPALRDAICAAVLADPTIAGVFYDLTHKPPGTIEWE